MKKKLIALLAAVAMAFSLAACGSTPDSVGTIGTVDITSGLYLLAQYDAYRRPLIWPPRSRMPPM